MLNEIEHLRQKMAALEAKNEQLTQALQQNEDRFFKIFHAASSLMAITTIEDGKIIDANEAGASMSGSRRELIVRTMAQHGLLENPRQIELVVRKLREEGRICNLESKRHAEEELKESKEYLNRIINCIGDPIFVKDREHRYVLVNDAMCTFTGKRREALIGGSSMPEEVIANLWEQEESVFKTGREYVDETNIPDGQGTFHTVMTKKSLLADKSGNKQIVGVIRDITEYKRLESQFTQAQKMEAVGLLAGGVAHDLNNMLNVINGYSELALEDLDQNNPIHRDIEEVNKAGHRAASLISQLLAFSRKQILQPEVLNLNEVITEMSTMLCRMIGEDIELIVIAKPDLGMVNADPGQIRQIVMNLAVNARDAMPQGGRLTVEIENADLDDSYTREHSVVKPGPYVRLTISDNGIGMDAATQSRIFEPFFTTKGQGKGTGLGLSTVYGIVKQSNGFIWVDSQPGKGTTFKIYFPRVDGRNDKVTAESQSVPGSREPETVLVVEDEASLRTLAVRILRARGYTVLESSNGKEALDTVRKYIGNVHLVLTDVVMPGMSGNDLISQLKTSRPDIKVLYASGYTSDAIVHHGVLDADVAFIQKPFTIESLLSKVHQVLSGSQQSGIVQR